MLPWFGHRRIGKPTNERIGRTLHPLHIIRCLRQLPTMGLLFGQPAWSAHSQQPEVAAVKVVRLALC